MGRSSSIAEAIAGILLLVALAFSPSFAQSSAGTLRGTVTDPSSGAIVGASVTATPAGGQPIAVTTNSQGAYELRGLVPGVYDLKVTAAGFQMFEKSDVLIASGQVQTLDASLEIQVENQQVQVSDTAQTLEVSPDKNAGAMNLKGADLDALSEDPDQLQQDLEALAGPAAGPNGGQMYVNGFTAGQLPPKSSIREVRVNQNPFSAEYDQVGFGRIEIITKPGTDQLHGSGYAWFNNQALNSWSPFVPPFVTTPSGQKIADRPGYYTQLYEGDVSGSLGKKTSFTGSLTRRYITQLELGAVQDPTTFMVTPGALAESNPRPRTVGNGSVEYQVSKNNALTVMYNYWGNNEKNDGISTYALPAQAYNSVFNEHQAQVTDSQIFNDATVNETRFQYLRDYAANTPLSTAFSFSAPAYVNGGGNPMGATSDTQNHYEFQNYTTIVKGKHTVEFGARLRDATDWNSSLANANGSFTFKSSDDYTTDEKALLNGQPITALPESFTIGIGSPVASVSLFDAGVFVQDDFQWRPNVTLSAGMRFETQNGIPDHADYAPRAAIAWGVGKTKAGAPRTVLRGGWGIFYNRFPEASLLNRIRFNGATQVAYTIQNPTFFPNVPSLSEIEESGTTPLPTVNTISPTLHAPYLMQTAATVEQQLLSGTTVTVNYINARGVHQLYTANINTPLPGTFGEDPAAAVYPLGYSAGYVNQFQSEGIFKQSEMIVNFNGRVSKRLSVYSYYMLNYAKGTTGGLLSNYYNPAMDYGRTSFDVRNRIFVGGDATFRYGFEISFFEIYSSGQPYNITSGSDFYGTSATAQNSRPSFTTLPPNPPLLNPPPNSPPAQPQTVFASKWGDLYDGLPAPGESVVPINLGTGPSTSYFNIGASKRFNFGPKPEAKPPAAEDGASSSINTSTTPLVGRFSLTFSVYARNAFNHVSYGLPVGVITSPSFEKPVGLAVAGPANRQVYLFLRFGF